MVLHLLFLHKMYSVLQDVHITVVQGKIVYLFSCIFKMQTFGSYHLYDHMKQAISAKNPFLALVQAIVSNLLAINGKGVLIIQATLRRAKWPV